MWLATVCLDENYVEVNAKSRRLRGMQKKKITIFLEYMMEGPVIYFQRGQSVKHNQGYGLLWKVVLTKRIV